MTTYMIYRIALYGDYIVYRRGPWARREKLPLYLVSRESDGRDLKEFRRKDSAMKWAATQQSIDTDNWD